MGNGIAWRYLKTITSRKDLVWCRGNRGIKVDLHTIWQWWYLDHVLPGLPRPRYVDNQEWTTYLEPSSHKVMSIWYYVMNCTVGIQHFSRGWSYYTHNWSRGCHGSVLFDPSRDQYDMELVNAFDRSGRYAKSLAKHPTTSWHIVELWRCNGWKILDCLKRTVTYQTMYPHWYISWEWG